ncbi:protoporphyrinogen/coproporphyrinogen oxidase [Microbacterium elymi]|uniref:FAD-dependent oxidoreductase n=1 Tax=Microbacterium elymi TaxID=2909587 RepID=A0ABY5NHC8_9MICO|nr:FAD-dependent oxidoreductase [Microbacterium elymi]UUT34514.1 FAD-dependent oxidoreductase [Microbacterium elymi]
MFGDEVRRILGTGGAWRAYLDRLRPPLTIGHERRLSTLVRSRMGAKVLDRLVAPLTAGVFGALPDDIDVDLAAPGLNAALTRAGSLSGAVAIVRGDTSRQSGAGSMAGGMSRLVDALAARLDDLGADVRVGVTVSALEAAGASSGAGWIVHTSSDEFDTTDEAPPPERFDAVILAVPEREARRLLEPIVPGLPAAAPAGTPVETVTLVLDAPELDARPRGAEVVAAPGSRAASGALHLTAKWAIPAAGGRHLVRVAFGGPGMPPPTAGMDEAEAAELARTEASALFGVALRPEQVRAFDRARFTLAPPRALMGRTAAADRVRSAVEALPRLAATGAWLSGSGLAQVVPDAAATADRLRRRALFGEKPSSSGVDA